MKTERNIKKVLKNKNRKKVKNLLKQFNVYKGSRNLLLNRMYFLKKHGFEIRMLLDKNFLNNQNYLGKVKDKFNLFFSYEGRIEKTELNGRDYFYLNENENKN